MKKSLLLLLCGTLCLCACRKDPVPEPPSKDADLAGDSTAFEYLQESSPRKIFVLNEGQLGSNNATLDFIRVREGFYVTGAFRKMNPDVGGGLGDVGNDIAVHGDEVWMVINNSGIVEVVSAEDETEIAAIPVPTPRSIAFDDQYAYVTSWAGAFAQYDGYVLVDSKNPKGQVYRIDLKTKKVAGTVEVGYQPEGIACYDGRLFVANSGGISSQLPPAYSYDNTLSIIDTKTFKEIGTQEVEVNLRNVYSDGHGTIYVTTFGNYGDVHSGLFALPAADPSRVRRVGEGSVFQEDAMHVSCSFLSGDTVYCIGTEDEFNWGVAHTYYVWSATVSDAGSGEGKLSFYPLALTGTPFGMAVLPAGSEGGLHYLLVGDAGDYFNPGTVSCYQLDFNRNERIWSVTAGVCPGHFAFY
jgi:hypothetical protein